MKQSSIGGNKSGGHSKGHKGENTHAHMLKARKARKMAKISRRMNRSK